MYEYYIEIQSLSPSHSVPYWVKPIQYLKMDPINLIPILYKPVPKYIFGMWGNVIYFRHGPVRMAGVGQL